MTKSRLLISLAIAAIIAACALYDHHHRSASAKTSADIKVHAVDASTDQEIVRVQARSLSGTTAVPSTLHWKTDDPAATLNIEFDAGQQCVVDLACSGSECSAKTNVNYKNRGGSLRCHYKTSVGSVTHDPIVIVDDCCPPG